MLRAYLPFSMLASVLFVGVFVTGTFNIYDRFASFDKIMHFLGGFAVAWAWHWIFRHETARLSFTGRLAFILGGVAIIGVGWEIAEFLSNRAQDVFPLFYRYFHGGGMGDTLADMVANLGGALVYTLLFRRLS